ncbi:type 1 fimbria pilin [Luteibacter rhizovicinus]|uniref:Type 1 fimbria pilin n=1 Tax=Luteibacter rhizovicinus TaxID=242606 RepID=A0A4V2W3Y2_9GAMM|nr:fimbrial protein [Luteibacter rhizovicinus]TCV93869.1 type 1 fimbria pilin [Luteibacter rhizovicinus]
MIHPNNAAPHRLHASGLILLALCSCSLPALASTPGPQLHFAVTGNLISSCGFRTTNVLFDIGDVKASDFLQVGTEVGNAENAIESTGCHGVTNVKMAFVGTGEPGYPNLFALAPGGAAGIAVNLQTKDGRQVKPGGSLNWAPQPNGGKYPFKASYVRTGEMKAGAANAQIRVDITYD